MRYIGERPRRKRPRNEWQKFHLAGCPKIGVHFYPKKSGRVLREKPGVRYACILQHQGRYSVQPMCRLLGVSRSGYYAWLEGSPSQRSIDDDRLLGLIRESHEASGHTYGAPRILCDLREVGECVGKNQVAKIMKRNKIRAQRGYKQPGVRYPKPAVAAPNWFQQQFSIN